MFAVLICLGSLGLAALLLFYPTPEGAGRAWTLRASWAFWCLQPALLLGGILFYWVALERLGYTSSTVPDDVEWWLTLVTITPVALGLLAGTVLGGLAWRSARLEQPPTSHRGWALAAMLANTLWFAGGAWLMLAPGSVIVPIVLDVVIVVVALALLLWPQHRPAVDLSAQQPDLQAGGSASAPDEHLVG